MTIPIKWNDGRRLFNLGNQKTKNWINVKSFVVTNK